MDSVLTTSLRVAVVLHSESYSGDTVTGAYIEDNIQRGCPIDLLMSSISVPQSVHFLQLSLMMALLLDKARQGILALILTPCVLAIQLPSGVYHD